MAVDYLLLPENGEAILGYYPLSSIGVDPKDLTPEVRDKLPCHPTLPAILVGRVALDQRLDGRGLGTHLLGDALLRARDLFTQVGALAVVEEAMGNDARGFYERRGFHRYREQPLWIFITLGEIETALKRAADR